MASPDSSILAFGFGSPLLLLGLLLASIPVIIHLLHKRQYRETEWAAMRFLLEAARKNSRRTRLEQLILLAVRVLLLAFLVSALAEPFFESYGAPVAAVKPVHRIIVIDASFSMGYRVGESTRFDRAQDAARELVESAREGDAFNLARICGSLPRVIVRQPAYRPEQIVEEVNSLKLTEEPGELIESLREVDELLAALPEIPDKQVAIISDMQRSSWSPEAAGPRAEIQRLLKKIAGAAELTLLDLGQVNTANRAVVDLHVDEPYVAAGQEVLLQTAVHNYGPTRIDQQNVELYVDDELARTAPISVEPGASGIVDFQTQFPKGGEHRVEVRIGGDELEVDDRRWLSLPTVDALRILLVNGKPAGQSADRATHYLESVVAPSTSREPWQGATRAVIVNEGELASQDLNRFDCVFLCNIGLITEAEAALLQAYAESGGGVVIFPGSLVSAENYNQVLYRDGNGLLPASLGERKRIAATDQDGFRFDLADLTHPVVRVFEGNPGTGLESAITLEYLRTELPAESPARVALKFLNGDPAIVEKPVGRGRAILVTTSADVEWGTWPVIRSFPPIVHEMIRFAVSGRRAERSLLVGSPINKSYAVHGALPSASVTLPDGRHESLPLTESNASAKLAFEATGQSGIYAISLQGSGNPPELFAVNVDTRESDLAKVGAQEFETELLPQTPFLYRTNIDDLSSESANGDSDRGGLSTWLLAAVFALVFIEQLMAWRFLYGFILLSAVVVMAFAWQIRAWHPAAAPLTLLIAAVAGGLVLALAVRRGAFGTRSNSPPRRR